HPGRRELRPSRRDSPQRNPHPPDPRQNARRQHDRHRAPRRNPPHRNPQGRSPWRPDPGRRPRSRDPAPMSGARGPASGRTHHPWRPVSAGSYPAPPALPSTTGPSGDSGDTTARRVRSRGCRASGHVRDRAQARARRRLLVRLVRRLHVQARADAELLLDLLLDLVGEIGVVTQEVPRVLLALAELVALVGVPGTGLAYDVLLHSEVDQATLPADADPEQNVELRSAERRRQLVLDDLHLGTVADRIGAILERLDPANVQPDGRVELERPPTGGGLGRA